MGEPYVAPAVVMGECWCLGPAWQHLCWCFMECLCNVCAELSWNKVEVHLCADMQPHSCACWQAALDLLCLASWRCRVVVGRWLGPWVLCKTLEAAVSRQQQLGLHIHVVCDPGGGAPTLAAHHIRPLLQPPEQRQQGTASCAAVDVTTAARPDGSDGAAGCSGRQHASRGVLLLVPLTLGVGKVSCTTYLLLQCKAPTDVP